MNSNKPGIYVSSDSLVVYVGGQEYRPREGQTVVFRPTLPLKYQRRLQEFQGRLAGLNEANAERQADDVWDILAECPEFIVLDWTWTDEDGQKLPTPREDRSVIEELSPDEIGWLTDQYADTRAGAEKKRGSASSRRGASSKGS